MASLTAPTLTTTKSHPILFSAPMVRALLERRKTRTRRLQNSWMKVKQGDELWVRENFRLESLLEDVPAGLMVGSKDAVLYPANDFVRGEPIDDFGRLRIGRFMPRWASRITLVATADARMERLQEITPQEAIAEGIEGRGVNKDLVPDSGWRMTFAALWNSLHTKPGETWRDNPEVCVVAFEVKNAPAVRPA